MKSRSSSTEWNPPSPAWTDARLVRACLDGKEEAWAALIDKYKNLIYSIPYKYHAEPQDAADIFQAVCLELYSELGKLRKPESVRSWLITVAIHKSYQWKIQQQRWAPEEPDATEEETAHPSGAQSPGGHEMVEEAEREQIVRDAISQLRPRCQEMIRLLFFEQPPPPYAEVAQRLGLATGSIGFIRGRCLQRLQRILQESGFA